MLLEGDSFVFGGFGFRTEGGLLKLNVGWVVGDPQEGIPYNLTWFAHQKSASNLCVQYAFRW